MDATNNVSQKEKFEGDLKKEIKKLQVCSYLHILLLKSDHEGIYLLFIVSNVVSATWLVEFLLLNFLRNCYFLLIIFKCLINYFTHWVLGMTLNCIHTE